MSEKTPAMIKIARLRKMIERNYSANTDPLLKHILNLIAELFEEQQKKQDTLENTLEMILSPPKVLKCGDCALFAVEVEDEEDEKCERAHYIDCDSDICDNFVDLHEESSGSENYAALKNNETTKISKEE